MNSACIEISVTDNYRASPVVSVDIIACFTVFLEVAVVILVFMMCSCMDSRIFAEVGVDAMIYVCQVGV